MLVKCITREFQGEYYTDLIFCLVLKLFEALKQTSFVRMVHDSHAFFKKRVYHPENLPGIVSITSTVL